MDIEICCTITLADFSTRTSLCSAKKLERCRRATTRIEYLIYNLVASLIARNFAPVEYARVRFRREIFTCPCLPKKKIGVGEMKNNVSPFRFNWNANTMLFYESVLYPFRIKSAKGSQNVVYRRQGKCGRITFPKAHERSLPRRLREKDVDVVSKWKRFLKILATI